MSKKIEKKPLVKKPNVNKVPQKEADKPKLEVPLNVLNKQLLTDELSAIELFYAELHQAIAEKSAQEQYKRNKVLEIENMQLKIKLTEEDIRKEDALIAQKTQKTASIQANMNKYLANIKSKYGLKVDGELKYDRLTGKIID